MDAFAALADPVRRRIVELLTEAPLPAGRVAAEFTRISRPAVSRHLRVLREAGLVDDELVGRERIYRVTPGPLDDVRAWLDAVHPTATPFTSIADGATAGTTPLDAVAARLDALDTEVRRTRRQRERHDRHAGPAPDSPTRTNDPTTDPTQERTA